MLSTKDFVSFGVGAVVTVMGLFPLLQKMGMGPGWFAFEFLPVQIFAYLIAGLGFYLMVNSVIEITNSNAIGWISFLVAIAALIIGLLQVLNSVGVGPAWFELSFVSQTMYHVIFLVEGIFLMIAMFAMEI